MPPALAWKHPGLPTTWARVLERNVEAMKSEPLEGHVWLDTPGKILHLPAHQLEFREGRQIPPFAAVYTRERRECASVALAATHCGKNA